MTDWYTANKIAQSSYEGLSERAAEGHRRKLMRRRSDDGLNARVAAIYDSGKSALGAGNLSMRPAQVVKNLWWVPAGIAVLVALRVVIAG